MNPRKKVTSHSLRRMYEAGEQIVMLTAYDTVYARVLDEAGIDVILVGDSLGMVLLGQSSTVAVTMDEMVHHTRAAARGVSSSWLIGDLPFGSYHQSLSQAMANAERLMQAGAHMVKLEGGGWTADVTRFLVERGVPVCAHLGLTPQSVHALGGWRVQGRDEAGAARLKAHAAELADAGASMMVLELMPSKLSRELAANVKIPMIGIGAGSGLGGQVLVLYDMLGLTPEPRPRFVRDFMEGAPSIAAAIKRYADDVRAGRYPDDAVHGFV